MKLFYLTYKITLFTAMLAAISIIMIVYASFATKDISIALVYLFWLFSAFIIIRIAFPKKEQITSFKVFLFTFSVYLIYMILTDLVYVNNPFTDYFIAQDQRGFFLRVSEYSKSSRYIGPNFFDVYSTRVQQGTGFDFTSWLYGRLSYLLGGSNSLTYQKILVVWFSAMIVPFLYNTSKYYFDSHYSKIIAITFGLFSYNFVYSALFLRDMPIALFMAIGFYIINGNFNIKKLVVLILLSLITWTFRPSHGFFYLIFAMVYLMRPELTGNKFFLGTYRFIIIAFVISYFVVSNALNFSDSTINTALRYYEYSDSNIQEGGLGGSFYHSLPTFLKPVFRVITSQLNPFPFTSGIYTVHVNEPQGGQVQYLSFPYISAGIFWFVIIGLLFYGMLNKRIRDRVPSKLLFGFLIALLLLLTAASASHSVRRLLGVYPIMYLNAVYIINIIPSIKRKLIIDRILLVYFIPSLLLVLLRL